MDRRAEDAVRWRWLGLAAVLAVAAFLRFDALQQPSYWLDEILYDQLTVESAHAPWWQWLTTSRAEHAGLYYFTQWLLPGRVAAALFGLATIALIFLIARMIEPRAAIPASIVLALSPLHVYYSREARSYALLMLLTALLMLILLRGRALIAFCAVLIAMLYTAALSAPVILSALAVAVLCALLTRQRWYWKAAAACAITLPLFRLLYTAKPYEDPRWPSFPGIDAKLFDTLLRTFTLSALGTGGRVWVGFVIVALAIVGAVLLVRRNRMHAVVIIGMTLFPFGAAVASLKVFDHFFAGRYVTPALIGFVLLIAIGISRFEVAGVLVAILIGTQTWTAARTESLQKLDWRAIAKTIWTYAKPGELIVAAEPWSEVSLRYYLDRLPPRAGLVHIFAPGVVEVQRYTRPGLWLVSAGFSPDPSVKHWMCQFPLVLGSKLESFRLHYASPVIDANRTFFFHDGWADAEGTFRWATSKQATITIPRWSTYDETISFRVLPMANRALPPQTMRVTLNGHELTNVTLPNGWSERSFKAPGRFWINGANTLAFDFGHAIAPSSLDPKATDRRTLAASFEAIRIGAPLMRITALLQKNGEKTRFTNLQRDRVEPLINRLGFDPNVVWPRLASGDLRLDDLAETLVWEEACGRDLRTAFLALLDREPAPHELRELGVLPRERAIGRMLKWDEFRAKAAP